MTIVEIITLALSLSVDSFVVSLSGGVTLGKVRFSRILALASVFGIVQAGLFFAGWLVAAPLSVFLGKFGGIIGFFLLLYIGVTMIVSAIRGGEHQKVDFSGFMPIILSAVATSIDASAVGVSFALSDVCAGDILAITASVFAATVAASSLGTISGSVVGRRFGPVACIAVGAILIAFGIKILVG